MALAGYGAIGELMPIRCASAITESAPSRCQSATATGLRERANAVRSVSGPRNAPSAFLGVYTWAS